MAHVQFVLIVVQVNIALISLVEALFIVHCAVVHNSSNHSLMSTRYMAYECHLRNTTACSIPFEENPFSVIATEGQFKDFSQELQDMRVDLFFYRLPEMKNETLTIINSSVPNSQLFMFPMSMLYT